MLVIGKCLNVVSRNYFRSPNLGSYIEYVKKLNQRKIKWIIRALKKKDLSICSIAKIQKITPRWVRGLRSDI